jgi:hypothetical protein
MADIVDQYGRPIRIRGSEEIPRVPEIQPQKKQTVIDKAMEFISGKKSPIDIEAERIYREKRRVLMFREADRRANAKIQQERARFNARKAEEQARRMRSANMFKRAPMNIETRPSKLFMDSDRDGVANVFDCQPYNRFKQDVQVEATVIGTPKAAKAAKAAKEAQAAPLPKELQGAQIVVKIPRQLTRIEQQKVKEEVMAKRAARRRSAALREARAVKRKEKRFIKRLKVAETAATGLAGFMFPMTGLAQRTKQKGMGRGRPGRPAGVYKYRSPLTGEPVHVYTYRRHLRMAQRRASMISAQKEARMAQGLMKRGLPPQMAYASADAARQQQIAQLQAELQAAQGMPQEAPQMPQSQRLPLRPTYDYQIQQVQRLQQLQQQQPQLTQPMQPPQGYKREISFFNSNVQRMTPISEPKERWVSQGERWTRDQSSFNRPDTLGFRRKQPEG